MATFLLVHGAFRGSWSWGRVATLLRDRGHRVIAPTLVGQGDRRHLLSALQNVETYADQIASELRNSDLRDVVLVAHSFGGYPATVAADRESHRIARLVYLDAVVPVDGQSNADTSPGAVAGWVRAVAPDGWRVPPPPVEVLEVNEADRAFVRSRLTPMPLAAFLQRISLTGAVDSISRRDFVLATGWGANPYRHQLERLMERPGWVVATVPTGHEVMLDDPTWVADYLEG